MKNWFISPEEEKLREIERKEEEVETPDLLAKMYQEMADEEYARELVCLSQLCIPTSKEVECTHYKPKGPLPGPPASYQTFDSKFFSGKDVEKKKTKQKLDSYT